MHIMLVESLYTNRLEAPTVRKEDAGDAEQEERCRC